MTTASPVDTIVNPGNTAQRYILWGNGRIDSVGGAPTTTFSNSNLLPWYDRIDLPVAVAIWITNWTTGAGYVLDFQGGVQQIGGQAALPGATGTASEKINGLGLPYADPYQRLYIDWSWDPTGTNQFYVLDVYGQIYAVNGASAVPRTGQRFSTPSARKLRVQWSPKKAITMDLHGGVYGDFGANVSASVTWPGWDAARDFDVSNWAASPIQGYVLDLYGGVNSFGGATTAVAGPHATGGDHGRSLDIIAQGPLEIFQVWDNGQQYDYISSTPPSVSAGNGLSEVQTVTITGTPTGGSFTLTFGGNTTAATAFNATASTVQTNLRALASIGGTNVTVTGGPGPGTPYVVTFAGTLANTNVTQMTASSAFTGGSSPTTTVTTTVDGVTASPANTVTTTTRPTLSWSYSDPQKDAQAAWEVVLYTQAYVSSHPIINSNPVDSTALPGATAFGTDTNPSIRGVVPDVDLVNTGYTYFVRVQDSSGLWSAWASRSWTQNVPAPATPTAMFVVADQQNFRANLTVTATTGGTASTIVFQYSDDGINWTAVRGAEAVPIATTTTAVDLDVPLGVARQWRALAYNNSPRVVSASSTSASATLTRLTYLLTSTADPTLGGEINVVEKPSWTRTAKAGVFEGLGAVYPTVVSDGQPKARKQSLTIDCNSQAEWDLVNDLVESDSTLVLRDPFGDVNYVRVVGDWTRTQQRRAPAATERTALRHSHLVVLPLVEVAQPAVTSALSTVPPGP